MYDVFQLNPLLLVPIPNYYFQFQLVLRDNDLFSLPKEIGNLGRLKELHIQGNRLTVLPPELGIDSH